MSLGEVLEQALAPSTVGPVEVTRERESATVEAVEVGPLGVRVRSVQVVRGGPLDVVAEADALCDRLRVLSEPVDVIEADAGLGGAVLRSQPSSHRRREFWEVELVPTRTTLRKHRVGDEGLREPVDFVLTREQLRALVDELHGG